MRLLTVLATALALLFLSAPANAQVINGCIMSNGTLKVADVCGNNETPISLNVPGQGLTVFDRNGEPIGLWAGPSRSGDPDGMLVFLPDVGVIIPVHLLLGRIIENPPSHLQYFMESDCSGDPFMAQPATVQSVFGVTGPEVLFLVSGVIEEVELVAARGAVDGCDVLGVTITRFMARATEITEAELGFPRPAPLYVGLPPE